MVSNHWSLIQIHDLTLLINEFYLIKDNANYLVKNILNNTAYEKEYKNSLLPLIALEKRIETNIKQIDPVNYTKRQKRGILDPLGSLIKCITGNLDKTDADLYDRQIKQLQSNQNKLKEISSNQINLLEKTINQFQNVISNISANQIILKSRILEIESTIKKVALHSNNEFQYFRTHIIINQISMIYQTIYDILEKTEVAISFAKINTLHNSIVDPIELINEISRFKNQLTTDMLPLEANIENILNFEKIIEIKSYSKGPIITFILELPLIETDVYHYYQLYPLPIPSEPGPQFFVNLPHKPYLALSNIKYSYMDQTCTQLLPNEYLCRQAHTAYINEDPPCAVQLISYKENTTTCYPFRIKLQDVQITKITDGKWIVTVPKQLIVPVSCPNSKDNIPLYGSYLVESINECSLQVKSFILRTYKPNRLNYNDVSLPMLNLSMSYHQKRDFVFNPPVLDLNTINLKETQEIVTALQDQKKILQEVTNPVELNRINFWTILLYIIILIIFIYLAYKLLLKTKCLKNAVEISSKEDIVI